MTNCWDLGVAVNSSANSPVHYSAQCARSVLMAIPAHLQKRPDKCAHFFFRPSTSVHTFLGVILQVCTLCFGPICKCAHIIVFLATSVQRFFDDHKKCVHTCFTECSFFLLATQVCTLFLLLAPQNSGSRVRACARAGVHTCSLLADWHSRTASTAGCPPPPRPPPWVGVLEGWATPPGRSSGLGGRGIAERELWSWPMA